MVCWVAGTLCVEPTKHLSVVGSTAKNRHWLICVDATLSIPEFNTMHQNVDNLIIKFAEILDRDPLDQMEDTYSILRIFTEAIAQDCMSNLYLNGYDDAMMQIKQHLGIEK
jgi:hypothetical protein